MKRRSVLIVVYSLLFAAVFLWKPVQKAEHGVPVWASLHQKAHYTATPDLPVFPPDLFLDRNDDNEEDLARGVHEHAFTDFLHDFFSWIQSRHPDVHNREKLYGQSYLAFLTPEKYIFFRSIRI
ncbi:hypothetical protein LL912_04100 [Niabella sp. CC-SYL272]|uniref:hypothetical protein n=1 Tax=Niabella agricola TaxID=2891571 RepID=UPI001F349AEC|nr:hypothetical protein [Niabella agricola]MCF3107953.1 hypothetical protein [Niabella agricola]